MSKKLLLADDSVTIQKVIGISFANEDITLVTVDNGDDAIKKTRELRPDLVLADVVMPGKTGYEVCEAIKSDPNLSHIPVLLLTGTFEAFDEERARQVGAAGHVAKPFEAQTLVNQVRQLLASSAVATEASASTEIDAPISVVGEAADESFDFFSEDLASAEPIPAIPAAETVVEHFDSARSRDALSAGEELEFGDSLDLGADLSGQDEAFSFGDDAFDLTPEAVPLANALELDTAPRAESTVAILPDDESGPILSAEEATAYDEATLATELLEPDFGAQGDDLFAVDADPLEPVAAVSIENEAATMLLDDDAEALSADMGDLAEATVLDPVSASGFDVTSSDFGGPTSTPAAPTQVDRDRAESFSPPASRTPARVALGPDDSRAALDALVPKLREQLHDTLEKVAWESFGSITEEIVRQAVDRVEAVAWEVIPRIAETLIQEEIRKMKGEE